MPRLPHLIRLLATLSLIGFTVPHGVRADGLFENQLSESELAQNQEQIQGLKRIVELVGSIKLVLAYDQMEDGDCTPAIEIDSKAKAGDAESQWILADLYRQGLCVEEDAHATVKWLQEAAQQGYARAQYELGWAYMTGSTVTVDGAEAVRLLSAAAEQHLPKAAEALAEMYLKGEGGVPQDRQRAIDHYQAAVRMGSQDAAVSLALVYLQNEDADLAIQYALPIANRAHYGAQLLMSYALALKAEKMDRPAEPTASLGPTEDWIEAHKWANLAASSPTESTADTATTLRTEIESRISSKELKEAQRRASQWQATTQSVESPEIAAEQRAIGPSTVGLSEIGALTPDEAQNALLNAGVAIERTAFYDVIKADDLHTVKLFLQAGASVEERFPADSGSTPLYVATEWEARKVFDYLMSRGAQVNIYKTNGKTPLLRAIAFENDYMIERLLDAGASAKQVIAAREDVLNPRSSSLQYVLLDDVCDDRKVRLIRLVLQHGASVDERYFRWDQTTLMAAVDCPKAFSELLAQGADVRLVDTNGNGVIAAVVNEAVNEGGTPNLEVLRLGLEAGASANTPNERPLLGVTYLGNAPAAQILLEHGASPNYGYTFGTEDIPMLFEGEARALVMSGATPLMLAAYYGHAGLAKVLLDAGADKTTTINLNEQSVRAVDIARTAGKSLVVQVLDR